MAPEEKFAIDKPKQELLDKLGKFVEKIENLAHNKAPHADKLDGMACIMSRLQTPG